MYRKYTLLQYTLLQYTLLQYALFVICLSGVSCIETQVSDQEYTPRGLYRNTDRGVQIEDCSGLMGGLAYLDRCGVCDSDFSNDCVKDCLGIWGGQSTCDDMRINTMNAVDADVEDLEDMMIASPPIDDLSMPDLSMPDLSMPDLSASDLSPPPLGELDMMSSIDCDVLMDECGVCDEEPANDCVQDCAGVWGGSSTLDLCDECVTDVTQRCEVDWRPRDDLGHESGAQSVPITCRDGVQTQGERGVDCGGPCHECDVLNVADLTILIALYYQELIFPGMYELAKIYQLKVVGDIAYVHYGFASTEAPLVIIGQDARRIQFEQDGLALNIIEFGGFESGVDVTPYHCHDHRLTGDEVELDCGGSCAPCHTLNEAAIALQIKRYYDHMGEWAGRYILNTIPTLVWDAGEVSALYGYGTSYNPREILGYDTRTFLP
jgi:hypothetical protein